MKAARFHPAAEKEVLKASKWYEQQRRGLGRRFRRDLETAVGKLCARPVRGANYKDTAYRFLRLGGFPFIVFYLDLPDCLWVAAVAHGSRRPDYWRKRKPPGN